MYWMAAIMTLSLLGIIGLGIYYEFRPAGLKLKPPPWLRGAVFGNLVLFFVAQIAVLLLGIQDAMAQHAAEGAQVATEVSFGKGLAMIGIGLPTAVATIAAGIAVGTVGSSATALISERPEMFGRTLVYLGLAEGIAIYGLVVSILN